MSQFMTPQRGGACTSLSSFTPLFLGFMFLLASACGQPHTDTTESTTLESILITPTQPWVEIGRTLQLQATGVLSNGSINNLTDWLEWQSSAPEVASIDPMGIVRGIAAGTTTITVRELNTQIVATVNLTVQSDEVDPTDPQEPTGPILTHLTISPSNPVLSENQTVQLSMLGHYDDQTTSTIQTEVIWTSSQEDVATVDEEGILTSRQIGTALITGTALGLSASTPVRVETGEPILVSITISPENPSVALGETLQLSARGTYSDATQTNLTSGMTWTSSAPSVATISSTGLLSALSAGAVVIELSHQAPALLAQVTIVITTPQTSGAGTSADPWVMTAPVSHQGFTAAGSSQYYAIPVHPSAKYNVHLRGMTADLGLWVYGDDETFNISNPTCSSLHSGAEDEICSFQGAQAGILYLRVSGVLSDDPSAYSLTVEPMPVEQLSGIPVTVSHSTEVKEWLIYKISVTPFQFYRVSISGLDGDADLHVSDNDATFITTLCQSELTGELEETCHGVMPTTSELYIGVDATKSWIGTTFNLSVSQE